MSKKFQLTHNKKPVPSEIRVIFLSSLQQMFCIVPMTFNTTFSSSSYRGVHSVENSWFRLNILSVILHTSNWLTGPEYSKDFYVSPQRKIQMINVKGSCRPADWGYRPVQCSPEAWFSCYLKMRRKLCDIPVNMYYVCFHSWRGTCYKNDDKSFTKKRWYGASVSVDN